MSVFAIIIISLIAITAIIFFIAKTIIPKKLRVAYERSLLKGDRKKAHQLGKLYFLLLDEENRKAKGIVDIDEKIADDFRAFNNVK